MRRPAFRIATVALALAVLGVGLALARHRRAAPSMDPRRPELLWVSDATLGYRQRANAVFDMRPLYPAIATFGEFGRRRGAREPVDLSQVNVLFAGDSTTVCLEVADDETISSQVENLAPDVRSVDAGVRGYSTIQAWLMAREWLARLPACRVVVYTFCANDLIENIEPTVLSGRPPGPTARLEKGELAIAPPELVSPVGEPLFPAIFSWHPKLPGTLSREDAIAWANANGGVELLAAILREWRGELDARGVRFLVARATDERVGLGAKEIATASASAGVDYVDPGVEFVLPRERYVARLGDGSLDGHWNAAGTAAFARAVAPAIVARLGSSPSPTRRP